MVNWQSPEVIERTMAAYVIIVYVLLGVYIWYLILSFHHVELELLLRRVRFRIAHIPYLVARYAHLATLAATISMTSGKHSSSDTISTPESCSNLALMRIVSVCSDLALATSNCNLAIRAIALWRHDRKISCVLGGMCIVDCCFAIGLGFTGVSVFWTSQHTICTIGVNPRAKPAVLCFYLFSK
ncbi:hypothetical protein PHLGIDRAFT_450019 [Phlebiopsis gigantea 11061_1 CR5-6]|uniref:G-protein coupled receptors family 1 profile domain-containing protein n=1 Tax=Phlebiopsis gigantea (strain 11061_1 CR5-6) TaxID=745531 RepID=A0A0C3NNH8_PHLG1|nr:hypothetical protein PHLGIDRAFT_450019 [Phlebiopsis gigantea 11061_1 CR5-6]